MEYWKSVYDGYITTIGTGSIVGNITETEYNKIKEVIRNKPTAPEGFDYRLKEDLTWELFEIPIITEEEEK